MKRKISLFFAVIVLVLAFASTALAAPNTFEYDISMYRPSDTPTDAYDLMQKQELPRFIAPTPFVLLNNNHLGDPYKEWAAWINDSSEVHTYGLFRSVLNRGAPKPHYNCLTVIADPNVKFILYDGENHIIYNSATPFATTSGAEVLFKNYNTVNSPAGNVNVYYIELVGSATTLSPHNDVNIEFESSVDTPAHYSIYYGDPLVSVGTASYFESYLINSPATASAQKLMTPSFNSRAWVKRFYLAPQKTSGSAYKPGYQWGVCYPGETIEQKMDSTKWGAGYELPLFNGVSAVPVNGQWKTRLLNISWSGTGMLSQMSDVMIQYYYPFGAF